MSTRQSFVIGVVAPSSGRLAKLGDPLTFTADRLAGARPEAVNCGRARPVRLAVRDSRSEPAAARQAVRELVRDERADVVVTLAGTQVLPAVADACEELRVPCVSSTFPWQVYYYGRGADAGRPFTYTFHFCWGLDDIADVFADLWEAAGPGRRVGALWNNGPQGEWSRHPRHGLVPVIRERGHLLTDPGGYDEALPDFRAHVDAFLDAGVDVVTSAATASDLALFRRQAAERGLRPKLLTCSRWLAYPADTPGPEPAGARVGTLVYWTPRHPYRSSLDGTGAAELAAAYERATGNRWLQPLGLAHALFEVAMHALATADDPDDAGSVAAAIGRTRLDTMAGPLDWTAGPVPNVATVPLAGGQWQRGERHSWELAVVDSRRRPEVPAERPLELSA